MAFLKLKTLLTLQFTVANEHPLKPQCITFLKEAIKIHSSGLPVKLAFTLQLLVWLAISPSSSSSHQKELVTALEVIFCHHCGQNI